MRAPTDMPRRRRRTSRSRAGLLIAIVVIFLLLTSLRSIAGFYTDYLWFDEVGFTKVFRGVLGTEIFLAVTFTLVYFLLQWVNLFIADRIAPRFRPTGPEDELVQRYRDVVGPHSGKVRIGVALIFALITGLGTAGRWNDYLLFRNHTSFGQVDPQFKKDIGFFVFQLPFLKFVVDWVFVAIVIVTVITVVAHYLNGGIRLQAPAERVTPQVKAHISVLLGALALVKAVQYWLDRFELNLSTSHVVDGATYTAVHAQLPAKSLLIVISIAAAALFIANIWIRGWTFPVIAVALWALVGILVGGIYPAFIQKVKVEPNEAQREEPYIERNIHLTRVAYGVDNVTERPFTAGATLTAADVQRNSETIRNVRLWDPSPTIAAQTYQRLQEIRAFYRFDDVDIDRYRINGDVIQTLTSVRDLDPSEIPDPTWVNKHLQFTHGYGAVLAPANAVTPDGKPQFGISEIPPQPNPDTPGVPNITEPRVYYGEVAAAGDYAIVHTGQNELDFQDKSGNNQETTYKGKGGVPAGSFFRRALYFLRFGDFNFITSSLIKKDSRVMYVRNISDRVRKAAPFLRYDADPYSVILPDGRIVYVQDAYTTTSRYPYSQQVDHDRLPDASGLRNVPFNYIRNSVKVVVDAYNGSMKFFVMDTKDPIVKTYEKAFPELFTPRSEMEKQFPGITDHLRYPEDLFRVQTNMYGRYHITDPGDFYSKSNAWEISQDPGSGELANAGTTTATVNPATNTLGPAKQKRMDPTYVLMRLPEDPAESFLILQPFVPVSTGDKQQNLTAFMTASSDPDDYGTLQAFVTPPGQQVDGPAIVSARIRQTPEISSQLSLLNQQGSKVLLGNALVIPIETSLLYVQPLYVASDRNPLPELKNVIVVYGAQTVMRPTLKEALAAVIQGAAPQTLEQKPGGATTTTTPAGPTTPTTAPPAATDQSVQALLDQAQAAFTAADDALRNGDLSTYQQKVNEARALIVRAQAAAGGATPPADGGATTTSTSTTAPAG